MACLKKQPRSVAHGRRCSRSPLINSESLAEGESTEIRLADRTVVIRCLEIGDYSVVVTIGAEEERRSAARSV
jgi:hypothetical protein